MPPLRPSRRSRSLSHSAGLALAIALGATSSSCGRVGFLGSRSAADTVFVGVAVGLEHPERYVNVYTGVQLALDQLNAARPAGAPTLAIERAPSGARTPVDVAVAFRDDRRVVGVVGHTESNATISAAPVYADREHDGRHALVAVSPTASAALVTRASPWVFRVCPVASDQARALARYTLDSLHVATLAFLYRNDPSGKDFLRAFAAEYAQRGGVALERDPFLEEIPEFDAYAKRLVRRGAKGVMIFANAGEALQAIRAVRSAGGTPVFVSSNPPDRLDATTPRDFQGMRYVALYDPVRPATPTGARFADAYKRATGSLPDHWAALGYDAATLIGRAVQAVGPDRRAVRDWIAGVGTRQPVLDGATGEIRFGQGDEKRGDGVRDPKDKAVLVREVTL